MLKRWLPYSVGFVMVLAAIAVSQTNVPHTQYPTQISPSSIDPNSDRHLQDGKWMYLDAVSDYYTVAELARRTNYLQATIRVALIWPPDGHEVAKPVLSVSDIIAIIPKPWTDENGQEQLGTVITMSTGHYYEVTANPTDLENLLKTAGWGSLPSVQLSIE